LICIYLVSHPLPCLSLLPSMMWPATEQQLLTQSTCGAHYLPTLHQSLSYLPPGEWQVTPQTVSPSQGQHNHDQQPRTLTLAVYNILLGQGIVHSCFFTHVIHNKRLSINSTFSQMDIRQNCTCGSADMMQKISCRNCSILLTALCGWQTRLPFYLYWWLLLHWCQYHVYNETPAIKQYTDKQERVQIKYHSAQYVHSIWHYMHSLLVGWLERLSTKSSTTHF